MTTRAFLFTIIFSLALLTSLNLSSQDRGDIQLYTPYTKISVPPGESIDYSIDIRNTGSELRQVDLAVAGLPREWSATLKAGGYVVRQIAIQPGDRRTVSLTVQVPLKVNKGNHSFRVTAGGNASLALVVNVSEQGTFKTELTCDQVNMEGHTGSNFTFNTKLHNQTAEKQMYALRADFPPGWSVIFKPNYKQATAVEVEPNNTSNISIEIKPPYNVEAGSYKIPVEAVNNSTSASLLLEVVITGSYEMELTTPTGLLSADITAGKEKKIELMVKNTGSEELKNVIFRSANPARWEVSFDPDTLSRIEPGGTAQAFAAVKAAEKAIPGDYVTNITAQTPETSSKIAFRISVKTPLLWGWLGILIILGTLGVIFFLFRKYGRR